MAWGHYSAYCTTVATTRWTAQTHRNNKSVRLYDSTDDLRLLQDLPSIRQENTGRRPWRRCSPEQLRPPRNALQPQRRAHDTHD